jgi:hypothetical protein
MCRYHLQKKDPGTDILLKLLTPNKTHVYLFHAVQTGPRAHSASCIMSTWVLTQELKRPERGVNHPRPYSSEVKYE